MRRDASWIALAALAVGLGASSAASATGFTDHGEDFYPRDSAWIRVDGWLRLRGQSDYNLDLDRGLTPSGDALYYVPLADPTGQTLNHGDMRLRTDLALYSPFGLAAVKVRADIFDNLTLGGTPDGAPSTASTQRPSSTITLKRAYGEVLTPFGLVSAGRMGAHWGLGMLSNGGDCLDCDSGDAADRIAFVTPLFGHLFAAAYDFGFAGPSAPRVASTRAIDLEPTSDVHTVTFAVMRWRDQLGRDRRRRAGKSTFEYGAFASHRWQKYDVPAEYLPLSHPVAIDAAQVVPRDYTATALDGWLRLTLPGLRVEAEGAALLGTIGQASLIPGVLLRDQVTTRAFGLAVESEIGEETDRVLFGLDFGLASGDPAWGLYASAVAGESLPLPGDLGGATPRLQRIEHANAFRFHPDYRIDRILFHSIIGTVTDAAYARPHVSWRMIDLGTSRLVASLAGVASFALEAESTPGGKSPLGVELDPTLAYTADDGFNAALDYAVLFPLAGLDNPAEGLSAKPAQQVRLRLAYVF